jgi:hypothetical protein
VRCAIRDTCCGSVARFGPRAPRAVGTLRP